MTHEVVRWFLALALLAAEEARKSLSLAKDWERLHDEAISVAREQSKVMRVMDARIRELEAALDARATP